MLRALRERKIRVPDDVSVIAFASELPLCDFTAPALAAMEMDVARYTSVAAQVPPGARDPRGLSAGTTAVSYFQVKPTASSQARARAR